MAAILVSSSHLGLCFSPLHEGDTSVAFGQGVELSSPDRFSPLHEGDTSVADGKSS